MKFQRYNSADLKGGMVTEDNGSYYKCEDVEKEFEILNQTIEQMVIMLDSTKIKCPFTDKEVSSKDCLLRNHKAKDCVECFKINFRIKAIKEIKKGIK